MIKHKKRLTRKTRRCFLTTDLADSADLFLQLRITRITRIGRALAALGKPSGRGFRQESQKFALIRIIRGQENLFNPLNRSAGTCFIKTYRFAMIKLIGRIYRI